MWRPFHASTIHFIIFRLLFAPLFFIKYNWERRYDAMKWNNARYQNGLIYYIKRNWKIRINILWRHHLLSVFFNQYSFVNVNLTCKSIAARKKRIRRKIFIRYFGMFNANTKNSKNKLEHLTIYENGELLQFSC